MKAHSKTKTKSTRTNDTERYSELQHILEDRRRELSAQLQQKMRTVRAENSADPAQGVIDAEESAVSNIQEDIEIALLQMKSETLKRVNEALARLEQGTYGNCYECGDEISQPRLRALPFAVRCKDCEEEREAAVERERFLSTRRGSSAMLMGMGR